MDKAQSPLLAWPVERVARPATVVCLRCRGWVGVRPQGFVFQGSSGLVPARRNRAGVGLQGGATALGLFSLLLVQFLVDLAFCFVGRNPVKQSERPHLNLFKMYPLIFPPLLQK